MTHLVSPDHLTLKFPYQETLPDDSPLFLDKLQAFHDYALDAKEWDKLEQQPFDVVQLITGIPFHKLKRRSQSQTNAYKPVFTLDNMVDVQFRKYGDKRILESITVHGRGWDIVPYSVPKMVATAKKHGLVLDVVHYKLDVSPDIISFQTIEHHFKEKGFTSTATATTYISEDRAGGTKATGWRVGSLGHNGYAVSIYPSSLIHYELPNGTWRIEVQAKGQAANQLLDQPDTPAAVLALISNRITFRSTTSRNSNRSQRPVPKWWSSILQGAGSFRITHSNPTPVLENRKKRFVADLYSRCTSLGEPIFTEALSEFVSKFLPGYKLTPAT
jgi:hypothetical protein